MSKQIIILCFVLIANVLMADFVVMQDDFSKDLFKIDFENGKIEAPNWGPNQMEVLELRREYGIFKIKNQLAWMFVFYGEPQKRPMFRVICLGANIYSLKSRDVLSSESQLQVYSEIVSEVQGVHKKISDIAVGIPEKRIRKFRITQLRQQITTIVALIDALSIHSQYHELHTLKRMILGTDELFSLGEVQKYMDLIFEKMDRIHFCVRRLEQAFSGTYRPHIDKKIQNIKRRYKDFTSALEKEVTLKIRVQLLLEDISEVREQCDYCAGCARGLFTAKKILQYMYDHLSQDIAPSNMHKTKKWIQDGLTILDYSIQNIILCSKKRL